MQTSQENNESELQSRNAQSISEGPRKWLLYLPEEMNPLIGFVHANIVNVGRAYSGGPRRVHYA
jgi:hypothetical protein